MKAIIEDCSFATLLQEFFSQRLITQSNASPATVASYRDTFRLLLVFAEKRLKRSPSAFLMSDLDAPLILSFLDHLEQVRGVCVRTRNVRLAAIRSFMRYAALRNPTTLPYVQRVLAIPMKRFDRTELEFLSRKEIQAVINATDTDTWSGHRDRVLLEMLYNTGARVSEIIGIKASDLKFGPASSVLLRGKGRKERTMPLWKTTAKLLRTWLPRIRPQPPDVVFPNHLGRPLSRSGVEYRLRLAVRQASESCPSLRNRRISPHTIRHTTAMHLLQSGVDIAVIALWLGHEGIGTTHHYVQADLMMKERVLDRITPPPAKASRYRPTDRVLAFLQSL